MTHLPTWLEVVLGLMIGIPVAIIDVLGILFIVAVSRVRPLR